MADLKKYRQIIQDLLTEIHGYGNSSYYSNGVEEEIVFDTERDRYLLIDVGWNQKEHIYGTILHIDIKGEKIWIQRNNTEINLADQLVESGVPKEDIVIGLHSPFMRQFSGYAVG
jgi:XisI protein